MSNTRRLREFVDVAIAKAGIDVTYDILQGKSHHKINLLHNGRKRLVVWAGTPSDCRAEKNAIATLNRVLREMKGD